MIVNHIDIKTYGASVSNKLIKPSEIDIKKSRVGNVYAQVSSEVKFKNITIKILFEASDRETAYKNISDFMTNFIDEADIKFNNLEHCFHVYLNESSIEDTEFDEWLYLILNLDGYEYSELITKSFNLTTTAAINNIGNQEATCIVEIKPTNVSILDFKINGLSEEEIVIKNLNKNETVVIDGIGGTVKVGENNKYGDTDMWEFPCLKPGLNNITFSRNNCNVTIRYNPRYF